MSDPNLEPVKLTDFDLDTLSEVSGAIRQRITQLCEYRAKASDNERVDQIDNEQDRLRDFHAQVLNAFSRVKSEQKTLSN